MLKNITKMRWIVYILYCFLQIGVKILYVWSFYSLLGYFQMFLFPILITILIIPGRIVKKICLGILNPVLTFVCWIGMSFIAFLLDPLALENKFFLGYTWIMFNVIVIEIIYQVDKRKSVSR